MPTFTHTISSTITKTRIFFLKAQVRIALRRSLDYISEESLTKIFDVALEKKYFKQIDVYGLDSYNLCRAHLKITIDWSRHQLHIKEGRETISFPDKWLQAGAIEIDEMTKLFREFVEEANLNTIWQAHWEDGVDIERARRELGTVPATPPTWRGSPQGINSSISMADEMKIGCYFSN